MRIAILVPNFSKYSGDARVAEIQAKALSKKGHFVTIFTLKSDIASKEYNLFVIGAPPTPLLERIYRLIFLPPPHRAIKCIIELGKYDLVISHNYPMNWLAYLSKQLRAHQTYCYYDHGVVNYQNFSFLEKIYTKIFKFMAKITISNADFSVSVSKYLHEELKKWGLNSYIVYNGIDTNKFQNADGSNVRKKYNLGNSPVILFVGRIAPPKGVHLLIKVFKIVKENIPNTKLVIVGKQTFNHYFEYLKRISNNSIIFAGYVSDEDLPHYYAACDVYCTCTLWEGFNLPLVEAQATGKPVVAFDIGPHREIVVNGATGFLVPPYNLQSFAERTIQILKDEEIAKKMGENGYKRVMEMFSVERSINSLLRIFDKFIKTRGG